jgi:hypothetical protein
MTIDDLIWHLEDAYIASPGVKDAIIAALRAAQQMRNALCLGDYIDDSRTSKALEAFDAATKGGGE